jgi:carbon storage regulator
MCRLFREEKDMLVLSRKAGEQIVIGDNIRLVVSQIKGQRVSIGIVAPEHVPVVRGELKAKPRPQDAQRTGSPLATVG